MARFIPNAEVHEPHDELAMRYLAVEKAWRPYVAGDEEVNNDREQRIRTGKFRRKISGKA